MSSPQPLQPSKILLLPDGQRINLDQVASYKLASTTLTFNYSGGGSTTYSAASAASVLAQVDAVISNPAMPGAQGISDALIPTLTSDSSASSTCTVGLTNENSGHEAWHAFDNNDTTYTAFNDNNAGNSTNVTFAIPRVVTSYYVHLFAAKPWIFQGSTDNSTWVNLDAQPTYQAGPATFTVLYPGSYTYYRLLSTDPNMGIYTMQLYGY